MSSQETFCVILIMVNQIQLLFRASKGTGNYFLTMDQILLKVQHYMIKEDVFLLRNP